MVDERHDFAPEWLKLITQMVDPATYRLLAPYDDAQSIDERARSKPLSLKSVGIREQGRITFLKINYRDMRQILHTASLVAADLVAADDKDHDRIPPLRSMSCGRKGQASAIIQPAHPCATKPLPLPTTWPAPKDGFAWGDMAVPYADWKTLERCASAQAQRKLPHRARKKSSEYRPGADAIQVMTMRAKKGLELPVVALSGVRHMPAAG